MHSKSEQSPDSVRRYPVTPDTPRSYIGSVVYVNASTPTCMPRYSLYFGYSFSTSRSHRGNTEVTTHNNRGNRPNSCDFCWVTHKSRALHPKLSSRSSLTRIHHTAKRASWALFSGASDRVSPKPQSTIRCVGTYPSPAAILESHTPGFSAGLCPSQGVPGSVTPAKVCPTFTFQFAGVAHFSSDRAHGAASTGDGLELWASRVATGVRSSFHRTITYHVMRLPT